MGAESGIDRVKNRIASSSSINAVSFSSARASGVRRHTSRQKRRRASRRRAANARYSLPRARKAARKRIVSDPADSEPTQPLGESRRDVIGTRSFSIASQLFNLLGQRKASVVSVRISTARVSSSAERLVICRLPSCFQTLGRNLGVMRFPGKVTTANRGTAIVGRPLQRSRGRYGYGLGRLPGAFLLHLPRSLTGPQAHV